MRTGTYNGDMEKSTSYVIAGAILGLCLIITGSIVAYSIYVVRSEDVLSVTGSAKQAVTADSVRWRGQFTRTAPLDNVKNGYALIAADKKKVLDILISKGFEEKDVVFSPVYLDDSFKYNQYAPQEYRLSQTFDLNSANIEAVSALGKDVQPFVDAGVIFSTQSLEYYYSQLPALRVSLLQDAIKDAQARAASITGATGKTVGPLRSAASGVVQVLPVNSVEISDYGTYDTSSIEKEVMVTVKAVFSVK